ncbi:3-oxoacyl-ACP synthase III family protein [Lentzea sp. NPDC051213]|uniref:3-oxoacyl-ACP synthase III family protein n=1 Tax=Lentzea sp. NPDC051213 TaxID=3364126 RepID=UPI0037BCB56F
MAIGVLGTGSCVPDRVVTNEEIAELVTEATPEWILRKTGIATRRWARHGEATSDLAAVAATRALESASVRADRVSYLILSTSTSDFPQPPTACLVQEMTGAACFDINAVCAGFVYGVELARSLVAARPGALALVIGADVFSRILDFSDRSTSVLLGDGAGAVVVGEVENGGIADVDCFVPHQANGVLLRELAERSGLGAAHTHLTVDRYGNLGSASVPVALDDAVRTGKIAAGDLVLLAGFGGGMSIGTSLVRWSA